MASLLFRFLEATISGLQPAQPPSVRISAVRAIYGFCEHLKSSNNQQMLAPVLPEVLDRLVEITGQFSCEVLALTMETIAMVLTVSYMIQVNLDMTDHCTTDLCI